jgi:colanic acid/amylovoran biosynthesis glycosyltransferase
MVASYCTTFLKPEMLHIYRQVTGLQRYGTYVVTRERQCEAQYPFADLEVAEKRKARKNFVRRFWLKHVRKLPAIYYRGEMLWLLRIVNRRPTELMHIYFGHTGVHLLPFIKEWEKPCVVSFHGMDVQTRADKPEYEAQLRELLQVAPLVLARSHSLLDRLRALGCPDEKIRLNRTGIPLAAYPFAQRALPVDGAWHFVQACRLVEKKGLKTALAAFAKFHRENPRARFTIAGEGPMRETVLQTIAELGLGGAVTLAGFLDQTQLAALYREAQVFVHPSEMTADQNQEGVPNSMLEAMSTGLPVLATLHGGIPEAVENGRTGQLVPERDVQGLYAKMRELTASEAGWRAMGEAASAAVSAEFEQGRQIEKLESYYDEARKIGAPRLRLTAKPVVTGNFTPVAESYRDPALAVRTGERHAVAYLFERFPSFLQMFCVREVEEMFRQGMNPLLFSIREAEEKTPGQFPLARQVNYLPEDAVLNERVRALRAAGKVPGRIWEIFTQWGAQGDKMRLYQAHYLGTILQQHGIRHVHAHFAGIAARTAYWMKQFFGITYSFTGHANDMFCMGEFPVSFEDLLREASFVATVTDYSREWLRGKFPQHVGKVMRVYNGIEPERFALAQPGPGAPLLLSVGRCVEKKGFAVLIAACALLRQHGVDFRCQIIGSGPLEAELRTQIATLGLADVVEMPGARGEDEVRTSLSQARVFVLPCVTEQDGGMDNLPTVIMEAMAAGLPVVSTPLAGLREMVVPEETGLLVPERDVEALAGAITRLLGDAALARKFGPAARALVDEKFALPATTKSLVELMVRRGRAKLTPAAVQQNPGLIGAAVLRRTGF